MSSIRGETRAEGKSKPLKKREREEKTCQTRKTKIQIEGHLAEHKTLDSAFLCYMENENIFCVVWAALTVQ